MDKKVKDFFDPLPTIDFKGFLLFGYFLAIKTLSCKIIYERSLLNLFRPEILLD